MERDTDSEFWLGDSNGPMGDVGAFMDPELRVDRADLPGLLCQLDGERSLIAIAGAPGAGKSRLAADLARALNAWGEGSAALVTMDGFHLDNATLDARGLRDRKGAPETFDAPALLALVTRLRQGGEDASAPGFDRAADCTLPDACRIPAETRFVLIEGCYLLLNRPVWRDLYPMFDMSIRLDVPETTLRGRLRARWQDLPPAEATRRIEENDLPNGRILKSEGRAADLVIRDTAV